MHESLTWLAIERVHNIESPLITEYDICIAYKVYATALFLHLVAIHTLALTDARYYQSRLFHLSIMRSSVLLTALFGAVAHAQTQWEVRADFSSEYLLLQINSHDAGTKY